VTPGGNPTTWYVRYGWAGTAIKATAAAPLPDAVQGGPVPVSVTLADLPPATRVYAQLVAVSGKHDDGGPIMSVLTAPAAAPAPERPAEEQPPAQSQPGAPPAAEPPPAPVVGKTVTAGVDAGSVRVRMPGGDGFQDLFGATAVPVGSIVDARAGAIALTAALPGGGVQQASFGGGRFAIGQGRRGRVDLRLRGGRFAACRPGAVDRSLAAMAAGKKRKKPVRSLWGKDDGGRFRTHGRDSVTTVRGTEWTVQDRCDGTLTTVAEGAVDVRIRRGGRLVRLEAGQRFLARHGRR
jgi:hypothetical protein